VTGNDDITIGMDDASVGPVVPPPGIGYSKGAGSRSPRSTYVTSGEGSGMPGTIAAADAASDAMSTHTVQEDQDDGDGSTLRLHQQQQLQ
jgi:hypothetical protein